MTKLDGHKLAQALVEVDVALVPAQARAWPPMVCVVVDELRASSTITAALDAGCPAVVVTSTLREARRLAEARGSLLAGERKGRKPKGFDANNSPVALPAMGLDGREVILCTTNGTHVLQRVQRMPAVFVGCLLNARAVASEALSEARSMHLGIGIVCAGQSRRFALDDAVAAGLIVEHVVAESELLGYSCRLTDAARAASHLRDAFPDASSALRDSGSGRLLTALGLMDEIEFCARSDTSSMVPTLRPGYPLIITRR